MQTVIQAINEFAAEAGKEKWDWVPPATNDELLNKIKALAETGIAEAYLITEKAKRYEQLNALKAEVTEKLLAEDEAVDINEIADLFHRLERDLVRSRIIDRKSVV